MTMLIHYGYKHFIPARCMNCQLNKRLPYLEPYNVRADQWFVSSCMRIDHPMLQKLGGGGLIENGSFTLEEGSATLAYINDLLLYFKK